MFTINGIKCVPCKKNSDASGKKGSANVSRQGSRAHFPKEKICGCQTPCHIRSYIGRVFFYGFDEKCVMLWYCA